MVIYFIFVYSCMGLVILHVVIVCKLLCDLCCWFLYYDVLLLMVFTYKICLFCGFCVLLSFVSVCKSLMEGVLYKMSTWLLLYLVISFANVHHNTSYMYIVLVISLGFVSKPLQSKTVNINFYFQYIHSAGIIHRVCWTPTFSWFITLFGAPDAG